MRHGMDGRQMRRVRAAGILRRCVRAVQLRRRIHVRRRPQRHGLPVPRRILWLDVRRVQLPAENQPSYKI